MVNDDNIENDVIVEELRTGYRFNEKVLRSALVRINKNEKDKNEKDKRGEV
jgi:GrpE.